MASSCLVISAPCGGSLALLLPAPLEGLRFFEAAARHQGFATGVDPHCRVGILSMDQELRARTGRAQRQRRVCAPTKAFSVTWQLISILLTSLRLQANWCTCRADPGLWEVDGSDPLVFGPGSGAGPSRACTRRPAPVRGPFPS